MQKSDLAKELARRMRLTRAEAADELDRVVHGLMRRLKKGEAASLPGFGTFVSETSDEFPLEQSRKQAKRVRQ